MIAEVRVIGSIGGKNGVNLSDVEKQLANYKNITGIRLVINSPGGYVDVANAIRATLQRYNVPITTEAFGECSSAGTILFLSGSKRIIHRGTRFLVHPPSGAIEGTYKTMKEQLSNFKKLEDEIIQMYQSYNKKNPLSTKEWDKILYAETSIPAEQLYTLGIATEIFKPIYNMAKNRKMPIMRSLKKSFGLVKMIDAKTADGTALYVDTEDVGSLVGAEVYLAGTEETAPAGEHTIDIAGVVYNIVVDEMGVITSATPAQAPAANANEPAATAQTEEVATLLAEMKKSFESKMEAMEKQIKALQEDNETLASVMKTATGKGFTMNADRRDTQLETKETRYTEHKPNIKF